MQAWLTSTAFGAMAADEESRAILKRFPLGTTFPAEIKVRHSRSGPWHRRYWLLITMCAENIERVDIRELGDDASPVQWMPVNGREDMHVAMKLITGLCDKLVTSAGDITVITRIPRSTAFDEMEPDHWPPYWRRVLDAVHQRVLRNIEIASIEEEIARLAS